MNCSFFRIWSKHLWVTITKLLLSYFQFIIDDPDSVEIKDIVGNGMVNYVYRVTSKDKKQSVIIKYGEEEMRVRIYI